MKHDPRTDTALDLSLSEISALAARAARGAGRTWGEAEEAAAAACWLARAGMDWAGALLAVLDSTAGDTECALRAGIALADAAALSDAVTPARRRLDCPGFMLPFAARMAERTGQRITLDWAGTRVVLAPGAAPRVEGPVSIVGRAEVTIQPDTGGRTPCPDWPQTHRGAVSARHYARLMQFMMAFTVPTSASSQAGAGAQEDDND
ncbi:MAG: DUF3726 domain-containing protein [Rhodobacteraceae bacterium]|nr:DUF3726 domain-containing protein [Paracoccaceae bacterium]